MILADLTVRGRPRKVLVHFDKNGFAYTMDRASGEVLVAEPFVSLNWAKRVDLGSGRPVLDSAKLTGASRGDVRYICPSLEGGKSPASPAAYSPRTGLFYVSTVNLCMNYQAEQRTRIRGTPYIGANTPYVAGPGGYMGAFIAWDAAAGRRVWEIREKYPVWSGVAVTGGDVVFYGTLDGWLKAASARSGRVLWKFKVGSGVVGAPITYTGPDGKQYVAVLSGVGGWAGLIVSGDVDARDGTAAFGFVNAVRDLPKATRKGGMLYVFSLP
jgi:glucose dehydrogenase